MVRLIEPLPCELAHDWQAAHPRTPRMHALLLSTELLSSLELPLVWRATNLSSVTCTHGALP
jgi:hypothetical protein